MQSSFDAWSIAQMPRDQRIKLGSHFDVLAYRMHTVALQRKKSVLGTYPNVGFDNRWNVSDA